MFPRKEQFPRALFPEALKSGIRHSSKNFSLVLPKKGRGYAVVVSKKTARLSVKRHNIKRRVLSALKEIQLPPALIVFPKASISKVEYQHIKEELNHLINKK